MKKIICTLLLTLWTLTVFTGCTGNISAENIAVGIIETKSNKKDSRIVFYDEQLNKIGELPLNYATVGNIFDGALVKDGVLYIIPQGYDTKKDDKTVLTVDMDNLHIKKFRIEQIAMNSVAADENAIYTCNNLNSISYINRCDKRSKETKSVELPNIYASKIICADEKLYVFGTSITGNEIIPAYLYVYDGNLQLLQTIDITECGIDQHKAAVYGNDIYFTSLADKNDQPVCTVSEINRTDYSLENIQLNQNYPLDVVVYEDKLFVSHYNIVQGMGGGLSVYDLKTGELRSYIFNHGAEQMSVANGKIYILADWNIYVYDVDTMALLQSVEVDKMDDEYSYLSGMFAIER